MMSRLPVLGLAVVLLLGGTVALLERDQAVLASLLVGAGLIVTGSWLAVETIRSTRPPHHHEEDHDGS